CCGSGPPARSRAPAVRLLPVAYGQPLRLEPRRDGAAHGFRRQDAVALVQRAESIKEPFVEPERGDASGAHRRCIITYYSEVLDAQSQSTRCRKVPCSANAAATALRQICRCRAASSEA